MTGVVHDPKRSPAYDVVTGNVFSNRRGASYFATGSANPAYSVEQWVLQATQALTEAVLDQLGELADNYRYQPVDVQWKDAAAGDADGLYIFKNFKPDYASVSSRGAHVTYDLVYVGARTHGRYLSWSDAALALADLDNTTIGLPVGTTAPATAFTRVGADGTHTLGTSLPSAGAILLPPGAPDRTLRPRAFDRASGSAAPDSYAGSVPANWQEVFGSRHVYVSDLIVTNGQLMIVFAAGSAPTVYYATGAGAWTSVGTLTTALGGTLHTVVSAQVAALSGEDVTVTALLAAAGSHTAMDFTLRRAMRHLEFIAEPLLGSCYVAYTNTKTQKLILGDGGVIDGGLSDAVVQPSTRPWVAAMSTDAAQLWLPVLGTAELDDLGAGTSTTLITATRTRLQAIRGMLGLALEGATTAKYQIEAESCTIVGAGASSVADGTASGGNAVQCLGTSASTGEGVSRVPGTDGQGLPTGSTYSTAARVRVDSSGAQAVRIEQTGQSASTTVVANQTYVVATAPPINKNVATAATGQLSRVLRSRYRDLVLSASPVRYHRLNDTNTTLLDSAASASNGGYFGGYTQSQTGALADGDADKSVLFNGTTGYATIGDPGIGSGDVSASIECWFKVAASPGSTAVIMAAGPNIGGECLNLVMTSARAIYGGNSRTNTTSSSAVSTAAFHHGVVTYDAATKTISCYVDGALINSQVDALGCSFTNDDGRIGCTDIDHTNNNGFFFPGTVDEVSLYRSVLSAPEVLARYNAGKALGKLFIDEVGFVPYKQSNEGPQDIYQQWAADFELSPVTFR